MSLTNHLKYAHNIIIDKVYEQLEHELNIGAQESAGNPVVRVEGIKDTAQEMTPQEPIDLSIRTDSVNIAFQNDNQKRSNVDDMLYLGKSGGLLPPQQGHNSEIQSVKQENDDHQENFTETTYNCGRCKFVTRTQANWIHHVRRMHEREYDFSCSRCDYKTTRKENLKQHVRVVHDFIKDFSCPKCYFHTSKKYNLDMHMQRVHQKVIALKNVEDSEKDVNISNVSKTKETSSKMKHGESNLSTSPSNIDTSGRAISNVSVESVLDQCIEQELKEKPQKKPFVPPTDGWKRFMDSDPPKKTEEENSKKESEGWRRFM